MAIRIPITRPDLGDAEAGEAARVVRSGWITQGPEVAAFEKEFAAVVGAPHAVALANCTVALELALRVQGVMPGDDVVTVSHSFIATANAIVAVGARPVFCDVEEATYGMDPRSLEKALTTKTKAILAVHQVGIPCDLDGILEVASARGIPLIEDAACAIGSQYKGARIGKPHGTMACFSLHPRKIVTTGDGGMITTANEEFAKRIRLLRQHAMSVPDTVRHHSDRIIFEAYTEPAFNYRLTDLQAAVGRPQLVRLDAIVAERRRLAARYIEKLASHPFLRTLKEREGSVFNWQSFPLVIEGDRSQVEVMQAIVNAGIACKRGVSNSHQEPAYAGKEGWSAGPLPVSERMRDTTILVPLFHGMSEADQDEVIQTLFSLS